MDVLSEVLKTVKLDGAVFYNAEFSAPWCFCSPPSAVLAPYLSAGSQHVIIFHLLTDGHGYAEVEGNDRPLQLSAGDLIILPHGDPHALRNGPFVTPIDHAEQVRQVFAHGLKVSRMGGGGEVARFICGYMACDPQLSRLFLCALPRILKVNVRTEASSHWIEQTIRYSVDHGDRSQPGGQAVLARLSEALFIEALRRYIAALPPEQNGWLAGVRDAEVGRALAMLHRKPAYHWTIASLTKEIGISRSTLTERFRRYLSESPMSYLARWRLFLGAQLLRSTSDSVAQIAGEVGYESEPAFNRAFKRQFGLPPARFRNQWKSGRDQSARNVSRAGLA